VTDVAAKDTTAKLDARKSGTFKVGGDILIHRLGFGAMRITGPGIWGPPADRAEALRSLGRLPELGIDLVDTANSYGPDVSEELIKEALHPHRGMLIATKAGFRRPGPGKLGEKPCLSPPGGDPELQEERDQGCGLGGPMKWL
jgi:aryl-alcohol dehydrogenase-like predicted oxidoreductase